MEKHASRTHYAILVGVNTYEESPLQYYVRDAHRIKEYLEAGPNGVDIKIFTSHEAASHHNQSSTLRPTCQRVVAALDEVTQHANAGSFVYIHFSGHGVTVTSNANFTNESTGDLALVLLKDNNNNSSSYLLGSTLAVKLEAMLNKALIVTLALDCFFSATVYRHSDPSVRSSPYDAQVGFNTPLSATRPGAEFQDFLTASDLGSRDVSAKPNWRLKTDGYAIFTACGPHELARDFISDDGEGHGHCLIFSSPCARRMWRTMPAK